MRHLMSLTRTPAIAEDVAPDVKLAFMQDIINVGISNELIGDTILRDLIGVVIPVFTNKDPQNPVPEE